MTIAPGRNNNNGESNSGKNKVMARPLSQLPVQRAQKGQKERTGFVAYVTCFINKQKAQKIGTKLPSESLPKDQKLGGPGVWSGTSIRLLLLTCPADIERRESFAHGEAPLAIWHFCIRVGNCFRQAFVQLQMVLHCVSFSPRLSFKSRGQLRYPWLGISDIGVRTALNETLQGHESFLITRHTLQHPNALWVFLPYPKIE